MKIVSIIFIGLSLCLPFRGQAQDLPFSEHSAILQGMFDFLHLPTRSPNGVMSTKERFSPAKVSYYDDLLDSAICNQEDGLVKESFTYNDHYNMVCHLKQQKNQSGLWQNDWRKIITYNDSDQVVSRQEEQWLAESQKWQGKKRYTYSYDQQGNQTRSLYQEWEAEQYTWKNRWRDSWTYDDHGNQLTELHENWDSNTLNWQNDYRYTYTYDDQGFLQAEMKEKWNKAQYTWLKSSFYTYHYDDHGNMAGYVMQMWDEETQSWVNFWRSTWGYDENDVWISSLYESWDNDDQKWVNKMRETRKIDKQGNWLGSLYETWDKDKGIWENNFRSSYTYTSFGAMQSGLGEHWDDYTQQWVGVSRFSYEYDARENLVHVINEEWIDSTWQAADRSFATNHNGYFYFLKGMEVWLYYDATTGINQNPDELPGTWKLAQNYPNPFNPSTTIEYVLPKSALVRLAIYNQLGQKVRTLVNARQSIGLHRAVWDGCDESGRPVSSGAYYYQLRVGTKTQTKKMMLLR